MSTRLRSDGKLITTPIRTFTQWDDCSVTQPTLRGTYESLGVGKKRTMADVLVERFRTRRANGEVFMNPLSFIQVEASRSQGVPPRYVKISDPKACSGGTKYYTITQDPNTWEQTYAGDIGLTSTGNERYPYVKSLVSDNDLNGMVVEASTSCLNSRGRTDTNLYETLAESDRVLGTLTGVFRNAYQTFNKRGIKSFLKESTGGYLGYRYGIKPLVQDVHSVLRGMKAGTGSIRQTTRASVRQFRYETSELVHRDSALILNFHQQWWDEVEIRAMSLDEYVRTALSNLGLSTKGLITLPWELTSYSFVLDWFLNVGDFIGAMTPAIGWENKGSCVTITRKRTLVVGPTSCNPAAGWSVDTAPSGSYKVTHTSKVRSPGLSPGVVVRSDFRFSNATRCLDAFSLLMQRVLPGNKTLGVLAARR
jgi:hypothetical protein